MTPHLYFWLFFALVFVVLAIVRARRRGEYVAGGQSHARSHYCPLLCSLVPGVNVTAVFKASAAHLIPYR